MKKLIFLFFISVAVGASAQSEQKDILEQVWKPFIKSYNELNTDAFMALYSKNLVRASSDNGSVMDYTEYAAVHASGDQNYRLNKFQRKIELRFTEHWINQGLAYETGVVKVQTIKSSGNTNVTHAVFHVILRKENGVWKIITDIDSSEKNTVSEKEFLSARPMEL